jgi:metal-sulfur cluster biosynthetic enzyme
MPDAAAVRSALDHVVDPCSIATGLPISLTDMGMVKAVTLSEEGVAHVELRLTSPICWQAANIIAQVEEAVARVPGIARVICTIDPMAEWMPAMMAQSARDGLRRLRPMEALS